MGDRDRDIIPTSPPPPPSNLIIPYRPPHLFPGSWDWYQAGGYYDEWGVAVNPGQSQAQADHQAGIDVVYQAGSNGTASFGSAEWLNAISASINSLNNGNGSNFYISNNSDGSIKVTYWEQWGSFTPDGVVQINAAKKTFYVSLDASQGGGATVYVEKDGLGHACIEVNGTVFSFGRYAGGSSPSSGSLDPVGPGVLLKKSHQFAVDRMKKFPTNVYNFPDANSGAIYNYLNNLFNNGTPIQTAK